MNIEGIKNLVNVAEGYKRSLEAQGYTDIKMNVIPDDENIEVFCMNPKPVKYIKITLVLKKPLGTYDKL